MSARARLPLVLCLLFTARLVPLAAEERPEAAPAFPNERSDVAADPAVTWGRLDNGMRFCLMANQQPKDKASIRLLVESGSLFESDAQRGLAHFLEHMAFNGTTHYPPGTLVSVLQGLGLAFGADTNAHTGFDETVYKLDLPDTKPETIATGLTVMADYAGGMLIAPAEVEHERGVILAEMRDRDSAGFRQWKALYRAFYPGLSIPGRFPIGEKETVEHGDAALLKAYYDDWYRPNRMVLSVVGAIAPAAVAEQVRAACAGLAARAPARPVPPLGTLTAPAAGIEVACWHDAEANGTQLSLMRVAAKAHPHDSVQLRTENLRQALAERILSRRLRDLIAKHPQGPLLEAGAESYQWLDLFHAGVIAHSRPGQALAAVAVIEQELRRFLSFGPDDGELAVARAEQANALDEAVAHVANRTNAMLADALYSSIHNDEVFVSPEQERALLKPLLDHTSAEDVLRAISDAWSRGHLVLAVTGADDLGADGETQVRAAYAASLQIPVAAPERHQVANWAYGERPHPGPASPLPAEVLAKKQALLAAKGLHAVAAGLVDVVLKHTDFKPNEVLVQVRLQIPVETIPAGWHELTERAFLAGGLGKHSFEELHEILAGSSVHLVGLHFEEDGMLMIATCLPKDVELCFQELRAYLTDPGWRAEAETKAKAQWLDELHAEERNLDAQVARRFDSLAVYDAPQRRGATLDEAKAVSFAQVRPWLERHLQTAPLTVAVVGDIDETAVGGLANDYFSSLPGRRGLLKLYLQPGPDLPLADCLPIPASMHRFTVPGEVKRALIRVAWPTDDFYDIARTRRLGLLAEVITERMRVRIREELGDAYSPYAFRTASEAYRGFGYIVAQVGVAPDKAEEARAAVLAIARELAEHGVSDALLAQVKVPIVKNLAAQRQQNQYWLRAVLSRGDSQVFRLDWAANMEADYAAITATEVGELAKRYLVPEKTLQVIGVCEGDAAK